MTTDLAALLAKSRVILLDFDGPVCGLFAGHPAPAIAADLRRLLADGGVTLPLELAGERDPMEVLRWTGRTGRHRLTRAVDRALTSAELVAVRSAEPTPCAREFIVAAHQAGKRMAVVSNNSADACLAYLNARRLRRYIGPVVGRAFAEPARMKPNPAPVHAAIGELEAKPDECVLIGDSISDIEAAHTAGVAAVGYANKPGKSERLSAADVVIDSLEPLVTALAVDEL